MTAKSGNIGGWTITDTKLYNRGKEGNKYVYVGISPYGDGPAFWAGGTNEDAAGATFKVGHNGILNATGAIIEGTITATGGSIAGWTLTGGVCSKSRYVGTGTDERETESYIDVSGDKGSFMEMLIGKTSTNSWEERYFRVDPNGVQVTFSATEWFDYQGVKRVITPPGKIRLGLSDIFCRSNSGGTTGDLYPLRGLFFEL